MERPSSPLQLGSSTWHARGNSPLSSPRKVLLSLGRLDTPDRAELAPRPSLVQEHLQRFKASLQDPDYPGGNNARHKAIKSNGKSSVDIEPQLRAMGAISQERMAVDVSSVLGPRPSWEDARPHVGGSPLLQGDYVAKFDRSFQRAAARGGSSAARIALLSQLGGSGGAKDVRGYGRRVPPTSVLWADIAELRGPRRLRQYIAERKRDSEGPLELLTDIADGWEELRHRQKQQQRQQQLQEASSPAGGNSSAATSASGAAAAAAGPAATSPAAAAGGGGGGSGSGQQLLQPVVYVAESDWPAAAAVVAAAAAAAAGAPPLPLGLSSAPSSASVLGPQPSAVSTTSGSVTRLVDGMAKPAPTSVVLVHFPQKPDDAGGGGGGGGSAAAADAPAVPYAPPSPPARPPPLAPRRAVSLHCPISSEASASAVGSPSAAALAAAAGFVPSLERYHTTYTLPSRALTTGADKLSPRTLVTATRLVEVVEVMQPPRLRSQTRLSDSSGSRGGGGGWGGAAAAAVAAARGEAFGPPQPPARRRHSVADPAGWAAGVRANGGGGGGGGGEAAGVGVPKKLAVGPALPVAAWAAAAATAAPAPASSDSAAADGAVTAADGADGAAVAAAAPARLNSLAAAASAILQAQRWKRLAASPAAGTQIGPGAFAHVSAVAEEAVPARTLGLVPALATSASQIVVLASAASALTAPPLPPSPSTPAAAAPPPTPPPPPGPNATKRMKDRTVAQLEKCWSLNGRVAAAAATSAATSVAATPFAISPSSSFRLPSLASAASSLSGGLPSLASSSASSSILGSFAVIQSYGSGGGAAAATAAAAAAGAMDVIHEGAAEGEEEEGHPAGGRQGPGRPRPVRAYRSESQIPDWQTAPAAPPAAAPVGLPPRPPQSALRSRSLASLVPALSRGSNRGFRSTSGIAALRRVRVQEPLPPPAAAGGRRQSADGSAASANSSARELRHESLRRLLSDQVRVADMMYGGGLYDGDLDSEYDEEDEEVVVVEEEEPEAPRLGSVPAAPAAPPAPPLQPPGAQELQPEEEKDQEQEEAEEQAQAVASAALASGQLPQLPPPQALQEPRGSRQLSPQLSCSADASPDGAAAGAPPLPLAAAPAAAVVAAAVAAAGSARSSVSGADTVAAAASGGGAADGPSLAATATDHSVDMSSWPYGSRTLSSFFTAVDSSVAVSEAGPSTEPSWLPLPRINSSRSSAGSTAGSTVGSISSCDEAAAAAAAVAPGPSCPPPPLPLAELARAAKPKKRAAFAAAAGGGGGGGAAAAAAASRVATAAGGGGGAPRQAARHSGATPRHGRSTDHTVTKRSGGGFLVIHASGGGGHHAGAAAARSAAAGRAGTGAGSGDPLAAQDVAMVTAAAAVAAGTHPGSAAEGQLEVKQGVPAALGRLTQLAPGCSGGGSPAEGHLVTMVY
ncbi:hypothetical protein PLESTM_002078200 [Pleodorina starrii]|nr:hypothetical protein PLESTM_002078200 [Pleodorina starrii]